MLKILFSFFKKHKKLFLVDIFCAMMVSAVDLIFPLVSRRAMYTMLPKGMYAVFFVVMASVGLFYVVRAISYFIMTYWGHTFGVCVEADIRENLFKHMQELDFQFYDRNRTGKLMSRLTSDLFEITELAHHGPEDLVIAIITICGALTFMFFIQWRLALVVMFIIPIFMLIVMNRRKHMAKASARVKMRTGIINADIESCISGIRTSKAFANEDVDMMRFKNACQQYKEGKQEFYKSMGAFMASQEFFLGLMPVTVIGFGGYLIMQGQMNFIDLITFTLFVNTFITPIRKMSNFAEVFTSGMAGLRRYKELMMEEPLVKEKDNAGELKTTKGEIILENVKFRYNDHKWVIDDLSLKVDGGQSVAIVGHSGGGKTTLCHLIPRFYEIQQGTIKIDNQNIQDVTKKSLRESIGIVQQDVFIFADTILENIRYGKPDATFEEVIEAAKKAEIYEDIMAMPKQFETQVGERGTKLSGGQKQRISIARIFLKNPPLLILDEATSALDTVTEQKIQKSLEKLWQGRTTLVIAHRLATVKNADRIVVVEDGKIVEDGTHSTLLAENGIYASLYNTQKFKDFNVVQTI